MNLPHDIAGKECSCTRCIMAVRAEVERSARAVLLANISAVLAIHHAEKVGESYQRRMRSGLDPLRLAGVLPEVILWPGDTIHDPERPTGCWAERNANECGRPAGPDGVCDPCRDRIRGLTPNL